VTVWDEVGDGCFRQRYESFDLNIGVIRGSDGLCVFELRKYGELARAEWQYERPEWTDELGSVEIVVPNRVFDHVASIDLGDRQVQLHQLGRGHTAGDIVATVSDADVIYVGDVVEESAPPSYGPDSFPLEWPTSNTLMLDMIGPDTCVVPGHGVSR
jgi:glyoxylase-like metal-dependent hydrolase (beta-lactamase superfamily II)